MHDTFQQLIANQYAAAFCTLRACIDRCPDAAWNAPVANHPFCRLAFHTLFFADYYLGRHEEPLRSQAFHRDHPDYFRDYEELEDREPTLLYDQTLTREYLQHCRTKATEVIAAETAASLSAPCGFPRRNFTRGELHVYNIRHIQHHAAQLSLRLRIDGHAQIPWYGSGWKDE